MLSFNVAMALLSFMFDRLHSCNSTFNMHYVYLHRVNWPVCCRSGVQLNVAKASTNRDFSQSVQAIHEMTYSNEPLPPAPQLFNFNAH